MKIYSPEEWRSAWAEIDPLTVGKTMALNAYSALCNRVKSKWLADGMTAESASNGRYVVHMNDAIERGGIVPVEYLRAIEPERDMAYDWYAFKELRAALDGAGVKSPARWAEYESWMAKREKEATP